MSADEVVSYGVLESRTVEVSGSCEVGANCFLGVNAAVANNLTVAKDCWIGPGVVVSRNTKEGEIHRSSGSKVAKVSAPRFFRVRH